jgi:lactoylglutathione lyase
MQTHRVGGVVHFEPTDPVIETSVGRQTFVLDPNFVRICLIEHSPEYREKYM